MSCLDEGIGRVLSALDEVGVADDTIVWFLSDNGGLEWGGGSNAPLRAGKFTIFEGGIRVPSIVRWPRGGLSGGNRIDALMGYIDVLPTLRRMVRANRPVYRPFDGIDVLDLLTDRAEEPDRDWFSYRFVFSFVPEHLAITSGDWKLVRSGSPILWDPGFETPVELYRIREDPTESTDVAESNPDVVRGLLCKLYSFASLQPSYAVPSSATVPEGWEPPDRWEIPPDPIPPPRLDRSQDEFRAPQDPIATAPGCPPPADEGRDVSPADEIPPTAAVRKPVIPSSVELAWTQEIGRC